MNQHRRWSRRWGRSHMAAESLHRLCLFNGLSSSSWFSGSFLTLRICPRRETKAKEAISSSGWVDGDPGGGAWVRAPLLTSHVPLDGSCVLCVALDVVFPFLSPHV